MAFCVKCGANMDEGVKFCPSCGAAVAAAAQPEQPKQPEPAAPQVQPTQTAQTDFSAQLQNLNNTADTTAEFDPADIGQNKLMAILSYLSWLVVIPLLAAKASKFARFHTNQGLTLFLAEIVWWIASAIVTKIGYAIAWQLGSLLSTVLSVGNLVFFVLAILGIVNAANGRAKELPVIGKIRLLK